MFLLSENEFFTINENYELTEKWQKMVLYDSDGNVDTHTIMYKFAYYWDQKQVSNLVFLLFFVLLPRDQSFYILFVLTVTWQIALVLQLIWQKP